MFPPTVLFTFDKRSTYTASHWSIQYVKCILYFALQNVINVDVIFTNMSLSFNLVLVWSLILFALEVEHCTCFNQDGCLLIQLLHV